MTIELALIASATTGCAKGESAGTPPAPAVLRLSQRNEPADLDPARSSLPDDFFIIRALGEGLLVPDPAGGTPQPAAAERWEVSADGLVYTFHLRPGAKWSNGEPVTAADFVASYRRLLTPATAAPKANLFFAVKNAQAFAAGALTDFSAVGFSAPDAATLTITLGNKVPQFPLYVASGPWIPVNPRVVAKSGREWTRPGNFIGNGPFILAEWRPHQRIVVKKNPVYRDAGHVWLDEIQFIVFDSADTEERAYRAGQIDVTMDVPKTKIETYARERPAELHRIPLAETRYLSFNTQRPPLNDARVRRALSLALDRKKIAERVTLGGQQPAFRFLPPALRDSRDPPDAPAPGFDHDGVEAKRLLAAAGFPGGKNFPRLELTGWSQTPLLEAVQEMWRQTLGIEVGIAIREAKVHVAALRSGDYDIGFITSIPDVADGAEALANFTTDAPGNYPRWSDKDYDLRIYLATRSERGGSRAQLLKEADDIMDEHTPVAPLYFNAKNWLMSPRVRGWREDALWTRFYQDIHLDEK